MPGNEMGTFTYISLNDNSLRHILFPDQGKDRQTRNSREFVDIPLLPVHKHTQFCVASDPVREGLFSIIGGEGLFIG